MENQENIKHSKWKLLYSRIIVEIVCIIFIIFSIIFNKRVALFSRIFASFLFDLSISGILIYIIALSIVLTINTIELVLYYFDNKKDNFKNSIKLDKIVDIPLFISKCLTVFIFIMIFITSPCRIYGHSMDNTFAEGEHVLSLNFFTKIEKGDVVVLDARPYCNENSFYIKRVIASGGDKISFDATNNLLYINGEVLKEINTDDNQYISLREYSNFFQSNQELNYEYTLLENELILMGDNRENSKDSRSFGIVNYEDIYGVVYFRFFPFNKFGRV